MPCIGKRVPFQPFLLRYVEGAVSATDLEWLGSFVSDWALKWTYSGLIKKKDALAFRASLVNLRYWYYTASVHPI